MGSTRVASLPSRTTTLLHECARLARLGFKRSFCYQQAAAQLERFQATLHFWGPAAAPRPVIKPTIKPAVKPAVKPDDKLDDKTATVKPDDKAARRSTP